MDPKSRPLLHYSDITSYIDGKDLSGMIKLWEDIAVGEARLNLLARLQEKKLGFEQIDGGEVSKKQCQDAQ